MALDASIPKYEPLLAAYHKAYARELQQIIAGLPVVDGDRVLEMACGDGVYAHWLARHVGRSGSVTAVDISPAYLEIARRAAARSGAERIRFTAGRIERLPFADDTFDLVWCAQSLYSLPDPVDAVRHMCRVVRPGGIVAVLENDTLHHVLLPWPAEMELAVRAAELAALAAQTDRPGKFYVGRHLGHVFRAAGLGPCRERTWATNRQAPLGSAARAFLREYLRALRDRAGPYLEPAVRARFEELVDPASENYLLDWPDVSVTCLDFVVWGVKPGS